MAPLDMAASTTVVVIVWITLHVTNILDTVIWDVIQDMKPFSVTRVCI